MRAAPPVSLSCPRGGAWRCLLALVPALAVGVGALWALLQLERPAAWAVLPALLTGLVAWRCSPSVPVHLAWDGQRWLADGRAGELEPMLDLHGAMLLRWRAPDHQTTCWLPVSRRRAGPAWHALRVAVHAHRRPAETPLHV